MTATVQEVDGKLVLNDPAAVGMLRAVARHNCKNTLALNADRVAHFVERMRALGKTPADTVIVVVNVDTAIGGPLAEALMPGYDWQVIRDRGEVPFARGLVNRDGIQGVLDDIKEEDAAAALRKHNGEDAAVIVVDHGIAAVFKSSDARPTS